VIQATGFHKGMHVGHADLYDASDTCPICRSRQPRKTALKIQRDPDINMLRCDACGACSASHMPKPELLQRYYRGYYSSASDNLTFSNPKRFARHLHKVMPNLQGPLPLRILDFGGGDGSLAIALAQDLRARVGAPISIHIEVVDHTSPRKGNIPGIVVTGHHELADAVGRFDIILASAILEHIPDAYASICKLTSMAKAGGYMYARTPFMLPLAKLIPNFNVTYPAHVHDMGSVFWNRFAKTFGLRARMVSSGPSLVETTLQESPVRTLAAHALKLPARIELALFGRNRAPRWSLVGGWEVILQFE
jgi:2-polyprenyl-3-methyl-5-hydroxy-6-metoxy-1,4-benzoquinol methylase